MNKLMNRLSLGILLISLTLTFSQCKKDALDVTPIPVTQEDNQTPTNTLTTPSIEAAATAKQIKLDLSQVKKDQGYAYYITADFGVAGDSDANKTASTLKLYENGKELQSAHSYTADIKQTGKGQFSHWNRTLTFSSSDNSDPRTNGRTYTYTTGTTTGGTTTTPATATPAVTTPTAPTTSANTNKIVGYAMVNGSTTGGQGGKTVSVSTYAALKSAVASKEPLIIEVSGKITGTGYLNVSSNKTILGKPGSVVEGVGLLIYGTNNVIIRNMTIKNVVQYSNIVIKEGAHHVWVDHCDLSSDRNHGWEYYDGLLDVGNKADYVTLSWNKLHDNNVALLIGFADEKTDDANYLKVTVHNNYFYNITERQPTGRFGKVHVFNNYMKNGGYAIGATMDVTIRLDNNYFEGIQTPIKTDFNAKPGYVSGIATNIYKGSGANKLLTKESTWVPTYEYKSALIAAESVPATVTAGAGATLNL